MKLDRALQREILERLAAAYPELANGPENQERGDAWTINAWYLEEHGLIHCIKSQCLGAPPAVIAASITAKGLDFLEDDGGLSAILGTVTVRLHADTLRELLASRIAQAELPEEEKESLIAQIRAMRGEALNHLTTRLLDAAIDRLPDAIQLLRPLLGS